MLKRFPVVVVFAASALCAGRSRAETIPQVQGPGDKSPLSGKVVSVEGIITGDFRGKAAQSGFFLQDPQGDGDPHTSDALFVYAPTADDKPLSPGSRVRVTGRAGERFGQTQITAQNIESLGQGKVTPQAVSLPLAQSDYEPLEGMLVTFAQPLTVSGAYELARYGTLQLSAGGRLFVPTNGQGGSEAENTRRLLLLDDGLSKQNPQPMPFVDEFKTRRTGDTVSNLTGVLSFSFSKWRLYPTVEPKFEATNPRQATPPSVGGDLKIASFNLHNYWTTFQSANREARGARNAAEFERQSAKLLAALKAMDADVVGVIELENNGTKAIDDLVAKLNAAYGAPTYQAVPDPQEGLGDDAIRVGIIYKPARVELRGGGRTLADSVFNRFPLAGVFVPKYGQKRPFSVVINHLKSKGSCPDAGDVDEGQGCWNEKRVEQAKVLLRFLDDLKAGADVIALGDFNAYGAEDPILALKADGLSLLNERIPAAERYSFVYDGLAGSLDHAFGTPGVDARVTGVAEWHINADEPPYLDPNAPQSLSRKIEGDTATPFRSSDHDPVLIGLSS